MRMEESNQVRVKMSRFTKVNLSHIQKTAISSNNHPNKKTRKSIGISNSKRTREDISSDDHPNKPKTLKKSQ